VPPVRTRADAEGSVTVVLVDTRNFLGLEPRQDGPGAWALTVTPGLSTWGGFLFGGCALGAVISAMEATTGRTCIWATSQYLSYARPGERMHIDVVLAVEGHQITQARGIGSVDGREILTVNAALGERPGMPSGQWERMPDVPPPDACAARTHRMPAAGTILEHLEQRLVKGRPMEDLDGTAGDGQALMWARIPSMLDGSSGVDASALAVLGDFVPFGVGQALGVRGGGNSLDNTLRVVHLVPTEWVLLDVRVHAVERGFGHGLVHMYAQDGTLLATASQSCIVRFWRTEHDGGNDAAEGAEALRAGTKGTT
jgi:acyl-CoA thioesterase II